jgi:hypothetical protein
VWSDLGNQWRRSLTVDRPVQWLLEEFAVSLVETTVEHELKKLGCVKLTVPPRGI